MYSHQHDCVTFTVYDRHYCDENRTALLFCTAYVQLTATKRLGWYNNSYCYSCHSCIWDLCYIFIEIQNHFSLWHLVLLQRSIQWYILSRTTQLIIIRVCYGAQVYRNITQIYNNFIITWLKQFIQSHKATIAFVFGFLETLKVNYKLISSVCMERMIVWIV